MAAIRRDILATVAGKEAGEINDYLIKFQYKSKEELQADEIRKQEEFFAGLKLMEGVVKNKQNKNKKPNIRKIR